MSQYSYPQRLIQRLIATVGAEALGYKAIDNGANRSVLAPVYASEMPFSPERDSITYQQVKSERVALTSSWVFSNIDAISKEVSTAKIHVMTTEGEDSKPVVNHPFEVVMRRPNPWMGSTFLKRFTAMWMLLRGEGYWMLVPNGAGELTEIWPIPSYRIFPIADGKDYISGFGYTNNEGQVKVLPVENICYFREPNPFDFHRGLSKLSAYLLPMMTDLEAASWNKDTFANEAALKTMISLPADMQQGNFEEIKQEIIREIIHGKKRYLIARAGDINAKQLGLSQKEMEFLAGREFNKEEIDRVFGVPGGFWSKEATEANSKVAREIFISLAIWPLLELQAEEMTSQILHRWYEEEDKLVAFEDIRPKNREQDLAEEAKRIESMIVDEVRALRNQGPHPNKEYGQLPWRLSTSVRTLRLFEGLDSVGMVNGQSNILNGDEPGAAESDEITPAEENAMREANDEGQSEVGKSVYADIRRWRSIATREFREQGKSTYRFKSGAIDRHDLALAHTALQFSKNEAQMKSFFSEFWHVLDHLKSVELSIADADLDPELEKYGSEFDALVQQAINKEIERSSFETQVAALVTGYLVAAYELGGGENPGGNEELQAEIDQNVAAVQSYAEDIFAGLYSADDRQSKEEGLNKTKSRTAMWVFAMAGAYSLGRLSGKYEFLVWSRGATKDPCFTCLALDGVVRRKENWATSGYRPQARDGSLECGGYYCQCGLQPSNGPESGIIPN